MNTLDLRKLRRSKRLDISGGLVGRAEETVIWEKWDNAYCEVSLLHHEGGVYLWHIEVERSSRNRGYGTAALEQVCAMADQLGQELWLFPISDKPKDLPRLLAWYERHGFVQKMAERVDRLMMVRAPRGKGVTHA